MHGYASIPAEATRRGGGMTAASSTASRARLHAAIILAAAWLLFFVYAYPGYLSPDSAWQLYQGRSGEYSDWHPPMMAAIWGVLDRIVAGPLLMLVAQSGAALLGMFGIFARVFAVRRAAIAAGALLLFPPVLATLAVIWKDSQMAGYLLAGAACLLARRRGVRVAGLGLLVLASAVRINAPAATLPLVVLLFVWRDGMRWWWRYAIAAAAWLAVTLAAFGANRWVNRYELHAWHNSTALHDIAGTIVRGRQFSDAELAPVLAGTTLRVHEQIQAVMRARYFHENFWNLNHGDDRVFEETAAPDQLAPIAQAWRTLIGRSPFGYLRHRWALGRTLLGISPGWAAVWDGFDKDGTARWDNLGIRMDHTRWQAAWVHSLRSIERSLLFAPYAYALLALLLIPLCRRDRTALALIASGLIYELSMFAGSPTPDFRYSHWMVTAALVALVIAFARRYRAGRVSPTPA
jgi:hypothetical protein